MLQVDFETLINGAGNDLKIAIDDFVNAIMIIKNDLELVKANLSSSNIPNNQD